MAEFLAGAIHTSQVMDCQVRAIEKAIRPLFTNPVTDRYSLLRITCDAVHKNMCQTIQ